MDVLMLWFIVSCGAGGVPNERGGADAADVEGVGVEGAVAAAAVGVGVVLVEVWGLQGASDVGGAGLGAAKVEGVR